MPSNRKIRLKGSGRRTPRFYARRHISTTQMGYFRLSCRGGLSCKSMRGIFLLLSCIYCTCRTHSISVAVLRILAQQMAGHGCRETCDECLAKDIRRVWQLYIDNLKRRLLSGFALWLYLGASCLWVSRVAEVTGA